MRKHSNLIIVISSLLIVMGVVLGYIQPIIVAKFPPL